MSTNEFEKAVNTSEELKETKDESPSSSLRSDADLSRPGVNKNITKTEISEQAKSLPAIEIGSGNWRPTPLDEIPQPREVFPGHEGGHIDDRVWKARPEIIDNSDRHLDKFTEAELEKNSKVAADIILRNDDLGSNYRREKLQAMFRDAAERGPQAVQQLEDAINARIKDHNLKIDSHCNKGKDNFFAGGVGETYQPDKDFIQASKSGVEINLVNTKTGEIEDKEQVDGSISAKPEDDSEKLIDDLLRKLGRKRHIDLDEQLKNDKRLIFPSTERMKDYVLHFDANEK
ncbi:MAG: hypothetical protein K2X27_15425 [Candidatus Obscuribacterales bacterium]|nr:hypothetical protein [Candidatus Obscuribacterales bacterium]